MNDSKHLRARFLYEFKACKGDDVLKAHLRSRLQSAHSLQFATLSYDRFSQKRQFRLLILEPGSLETEIGCRLETFDLNSPPSFQALSYVWGDADRVLPIKCNEQIAWITTNLYSALLRVRRLDQNLVIWVDALCIDQATDTEALKERAEQVREMNRIFSQAEEVIIDVGGATKAETTEFMKGFNYFANQANPAWKGYSQRVQYERDDPNIEYAQDHPFWIAWHRFLRRPWFSRVWVAQEFVLARKVRMLLGTTEIDPWTLGHLMSGTIYRLGSTNIEYTPRMFQGTFDVKLALNVVDISKITRNYSQMLYFHGQYEMFQQKQPLPDLLDLSRNLEATDVRDHIYGLAGLVSEWDSLGLEIDYTKTDVATRAEVGRALVNMDEVFYCLSRAPGINSSAITWIPMLRHDAQRQETMSDADKKFMGMHRTLYKAAGDKPCIAALSSADTFLAISGFRVDRITTIAPAFPVSYSDIGKPGSNILDISIKLLDWYSGLTEWAGKTFPQLPSIDVRNNLWRAMVLDTVKDVTKFPKVRTRATLPLLTSQFKMFEELNTYFSDDSETREKRDYYDYSPAQNEEMGEIWTACSGRKICGTQHGRMASVPPKTVHGNEIWIIFGIPLPMVLRNLGCAYAIVGPAYVQDIMDGEALNWAGRRDETIYLA